MLDNATERETNERGRGRGVLEGAFALLDVLGSVSDDVGLSELAKNSGLPKTTVHRLLDQLGELGAVERSSGGYRIGSRVFRLGQGWQSDLRDQALRTLRALTMRIRETVGLTMPREGRILIVASSVVRADHGPLMRPGVTVSLDTAAGKIIAAYDPLIGLPDGYTADSWMTAAHRIRTEGVAYDMEVVVPGVCCAAVPVRASGGKVIGALAVIAPPQRRITGFVSELTTAAQAIGTALGGPSPASPEWRDGTGERAVNRQP